MTVRQQTNLVKRGSVFYFRKKVPQDLRDHYGRESIRQSLRECVTLADAKREAGRLADRYEAEFVVVRGKLGAAPTPLTLAMVPSLVATYEAAQLASDDVWRGRGLGETEFEDAQKALAVDMAHLRNAYARGNVGAMADRLDDFLKAANVDGSQSREAAHHLAGELIKARIRVVSALELRNSGEPTETPASETAEAIKAALSDGEPEEVEAALSLILRPEPSTTAPPARARTAGSGHRLSDVVDYWKTTGSKSHRSTAAADTLVNEFKLLHGDVPLKDIGKVHFVALRDKLLQRVKPATVQARFNLMKAAFTVCRQDDQLGVVQNPIEDVKIRNVDTGEKSRDAFTADQLQVLFDSEVFTNGARPQGGRGEAAFWAPLLALFTGARLDEILSLRTDGLYTWEGAHVIHFRHRPELGQNLKGKAKNNRRVPVHPELLRLGLLDYAARVAGGAWLFPGIDRSEKRRSHSSAWGAWFGRYLGRVGIKSDKLTFHSFRHTFKHFARASGLPEDHQDAMTGHTTAEVARRYGSAEGYPGNALHQSMARLVFGSLDLSNTMSAGA